MSNIHQLIIAHGADKAASLVGGNDGRRRVQRAAAVLADDTSEFGITYSGFCLTALPHKKPETNDEIWIKEGRTVTLQIEPGAMPGSKERVGVPYGAKARMILLYLQTQAVKYRSREVELGRSMLDWMERMGISDGGKQYRDVREQAKRISRCRLTFSWHQAGGIVGFEDETIISSGLLSPDTADNRQGRLWVDTVTLSEKFFYELVEHGVPVADSAIRELSAQSVALDIYIWLAYRLHAIDKPQPVSWQALLPQFGAGYAEMRNFRRKFTEALQTALDVYPGARVEVDPQNGLVLYPSPSPITPRVFQVGQVGG